MLCGAKVAILMLVLVLVRGCLCAKPGALGKVVAPRKCFWAQGWRLPSHQSKVWKEVGSSESILPLSHIGNPIRDTPGVYLFCRWAHDSNRCWADGVGMDVAVPLRRSGTRGQSDGG